MDQGFITKLHRLLCLDTFSVEVFELPSTEGFVAVALQPGSPCANAGSTAALAADTADRRRPERHPGALDIRPPGLESGPVPGDGRIYSAAQYLPAAHSAMAPHTSTPKTIERAGPKISAAPSA